MRIPCCDDIELCDNTIDIRPVFSHRLFQRLDHVKQLGQTSRVFPGAVHTRLEHSLGVFARTKEQCLKWYRCGLIRMTDVTTLCLFALIHDIGHFPFSHSLEPILKMNHHDNGVIILNELRDEIGACGVSVEALIRCLEGRYPLSEAVSHALLGTDKIDYLIRDAYHTGFGGAPETKLIQAHTRPFEGGIVLEKCSQYEALQLASFIYTMYSRVYERSKNAYSRRLMQKLFERISSLGIMEEVTLSRMTDAQFEGVCERNDDERLRYFYDMYHGLHPLPWTSVMVCQNGHGLYHSRTAKTMRRVIELAPDQFNALDAKVTWSNTGEHEERCAQIAATDPRHVFIQPSRTAKRYALPSTTLLDGANTYDLTTVVPTDTSSTERIRFIRVGSNDKGSLKRIYDRSDDILKALMT